MRKFLSIICILCFFTYSNVDLRAYEMTGSKLISIEKIDLGNGIYKEITIFEDENILNRSNDIKSGTKTAKYKNGDAVLWSVTVNASFSYNGSTSNCISASSNASSYDSDWQIVDHYAKKNGSTGTAYVTVKHMIFGVTIKTEKDEVSISCSKSGVLS